MRVLGLVGLLVGILAFFAPAIRQLLPSFLYAMSDDSLRIVGGCVAVLAVTVIWFARDQDSG
jgi:uncharacterized protein YjeT (DUF2065 family)